MGDYLTRRKRIARRLVFIEAVEVGIISKIKSRTFHRLVPAFPDQPGSIAEHNRVILYELIAIKSVDITGRIRIEPTLSPWHVIPEPIIIKPRRVALLTRITHGLVTRLNVTAPGKPGGATVRVIGLLADHLGFAIQLQVAGTQMVGQVVAVLVIGDCTGRRCFPVQYPHAVASGLQADHLQHFASTCMASNFQARQVANLGNQRTCMSLSRADLSPTHPITTVQIEFPISLGAVPLHRSHLTQLIAQVPSHRLSRLQLLQIAAVIKSSANLVFGGRAAIAFGQAAVAIAGRRQFATVTLWTDMDQFQQVVSSIIAIGLLIISYRARILETIESRPSAGAAGFPTGGPDQPIKAVIAVSLDRFHSLISKIADRQGRIFNAQHVAYRIVGILQVLVGDFISISGLKPYQAAIFRTIGQRTDHIVAGRFLFDLAASTVANGTDQRSRCGLTAELQMARQQLASNRVIEQLSVALGINLLQHIAQRVAARPSGGRLLQRLQQRVSRQQLRGPIRCVQHTQKALSLFKYLACQGVLVQCPRTRRIIVPDQLPALIVSGEIGAGIGVFITFGAARRLARALLGDGQRSP